VTDGCLSLRSVVDLVKMKAVYNDGEKG